MLLPVAAAVLVAAIACGGSSSSTPSAGTSKPGTASSVPGTVGATKRASGAAASTAPADKAKPVPVESNPPGDIPDNLAFVTYVNPSGGYIFTHPEGWAQTGKGSQVRFTDKLNGVTVGSRPGSKPPTVASARSSEVAAFKASVPAFQLGPVGADNVDAYRTMSQSLRTR